LVRAIVTEAYPSAIATIVPAVNAAATAAGKLRAYIRASAEYLDSHRLRHMAVVDIGLSYRSGSGRRLDELEMDPELLDDLSKLDPDAILRRGRTTVSSGRWTRGAWPWRCAARSTAPCSRSPAIPSSTCSLTARSW
jgi:hypothetical protein